MKKAEYKFNKSASNKIQSDSRQSIPLFFGYSSANRPIFIPKNRKKK